MDALAFLRRTLGRPLTLRPILPRDREALAAFYAGLTRETLYRRFHCAISQLSPARLSTICDLSKVDHINVVMLVVVYRNRNTEEVIVAHGVWHRAEPHTAEFALVVGDAWQGMGLGLALMNALISMAVRHHVIWLQASVLPSNEPMLALLRHRGFQLTSEPNDDGATDVFGHASRLRSSMPAKPLHSRPWWRGPGLRAARACA